MDYEENDEFRHSAPCLAYYVALSEGMELAEIQRVPTNMNKKGYDALQAYFRGWTIGFPWVFLVIIFSVYVYLNLSSADDQDTHTHVPVYIGIYQKCVSI